MLETRTLIEVTDRQLQDGVASVIEVASDRVTNAFGDEGVVANRRKVCGSGTEELGAAHDESEVFAEWSLANLGPTVLGVLDPCSGVDGVRSSELVLTLSDTRLQPAE